MVHPITQWQTVSGTLCTSEVGAAEQELREILMLSGELSLFVANTVITTLCDNGYNALELLTVLVAQSNTPDLPDPTAQIGG